MAVAAGSSTASTRPAGGTGASSGVSAAAARGWSRARADDPDTRTVSTPPGLDPMDGELRDRRRLLQAAADRSRARLGLPHQRRLGPRHPLGAGRAPGDWRHLPADGDRDRPGDERVHGGRAGGHPGGERPGRRLRSPGGGHPVAPAVRPGRPRDPRGGELSGPPRPPGPPGGGVRRDAAADHHADRRPVHRARGLERPGHPVRPQRPGECRRADRGRLPRGDRVAVPLRAVRPLDPGRGAGLPVLSRAGGTPAAVAGRSAPGRGGVLDRPPGGGRPPARRLRVRRVRPLLPQGRLLDVPPGLRRGGPRRAGDRGRHDPRGLRRHARPRRTGLGLGDGSRRPAQHDPPRHRHRRHRDGRHPARPGGRGPRAGLRGVRRG